MGRNWNTDFPVCAPSGVALRCRTKESGQNVRLAHRPQACVPFRQYFSGTLRGPPQPPQGRSRLTPLTTLSILSSRRRDDGKVAPYQYPGSARLAEHRGGHSVARYMDCGRLQECWYNAQAAIPPVARAHKFGPDLPEWSDRSMRQRPLPPRHRSKPRARSRWRLRR